ncbi:MAG: dethiobiotin synthase [Gammaproteobacteria bacterium]|nr:dethiobiotin synthase [Gammaproteobacteria bacterium]
MKRKGLFIIGTDTDVGKTYITQQIIIQLQANALPIKVRKPIESGCEKQTDGTLQPADGTALWQANNKNESLDNVTPFRFEPAIAPNRAAQLVGKKISTEQLKQACLKDIDDNDFLIVEGAGGLYSPLCDDGLNIDLAKALDLDVILVVKDKLGCINHTLLTLNALSQAKLNCKLIILNQCSDATINTYDHLNEIQQLTDIPIKSCLINGVLSGVLE